MKFAKYTLTWCLIYLCFTFINKWQADRYAKKTLLSQNISFDNYITAPTILNNILWYTVASNDTALYVGEFSIFNKKKKFKWHRFERNKQWMEESQCRDHVKVLNWFCGPFYIAEKKGDTLNVFAAKFGRTDLRETDLRKTFVFNYQVYLENGKEKMTMERRGERSEKISEALKDLWCRIF